jgi:hypothetical protein
MGAERQGLVKPTVQAAKVAPDGMMQQQWEGWGRSADTALDAIVKPPKPQFQGVAQELGAARSGVVVMPKLVIGAPGDRYEQEADRVAQQVVQQVNTPTVEATQPEESIQRKPKPEDEEKLQRKPIQMRAGAIAGGEASPALTAAISQAKGGGQPLAVGLQQSMGQAMGADFSGVRVHADGRADQLNQSLQAKAFTTGQHVFFQQGAYQPGSRRGQELIAHELTHVVQQRTGMTRFGSGNPCTSYKQYANWQTDNTESGGHRVIQRYEATSKEKTQLKKCMPKEWQDRIKEEDPTQVALDNFIESLIEYCDSHSQALFFLKNLSYDTLCLGMLNIKASELEKKESKQEQKDEYARTPKEDEYARTYKAILTEKHNISDFTPKEINRIKKLGETPNTGWKKAVEEVWRVKEEDRKQLEHEQAIQNLIPIVEALRPQAFISNTLCMKIWQASRTHAGKSGKFELPDGYSASDLAAAWAAWGSFAENIRNASDTTDGFTTHRIGDGTAQDKSSRLDINTRKFTRQMNFSVTWKGAEQMIHVGLQGTKNPKYTGSD